MRCYVAWCALLMLLFCICRLIDLQPCYSFTSSGSEGAGSIEKKRRFQQMRKQHYNMKAALQKVC
jgi:hypothetical protein